MTNQIHTSLWFDGQAKAAADFYCSLFPKSKIKIDTNLAVTFELNGLQLMGINGGPMFTINPSISLFVTCETVNEANLLWEKLIQGGKTYMAIDKYPWSERYGWLQDRFGMTWQISVASTTGAKLKITPSMLFTGKQFGRAAEAISFYSSVFENSSTTVMVPYPEGSDNAGKVMFSEFRIDNFDVIAMDGPGEHDYVFNEAVSFVVSCETQKEIDYYWNKLTEGGAESMCGWLRDKFGVSWQIVPANIVELMTNPERAGAVTRVIMTMKKLDIATMVNAK